MVTDLNLAADRLEKTTKKALDAAAELQKAVAAAEAQRKRPLIKR